MKTYNFYLANKNRVLDFKLPDGYTYQVYKPSFAQLSLHSYSSKTLYLYWYLFTLGRYKIYYIHSNGEIVHYSHVIPKTPKFKFMKYGDYEIGPCWTHPEHRGIGLYPFTVMRIIEDHKKDNSDIYIFAEEDNTASIRGIEKCGFEFLGKGHKKGILGTYILDTGV